jgi:O-antigen/teichoic acid export membrane protein
MIANIGGGVLMWAVHFLSKSIGPEQYGLYIAYLAVVMCVPSIPLQMVLAHQTASALAVGKERELAGMLRKICLGTLFLWLAGCLAVFVFQGTIIERWKITNPVGIWVTLLVVLFSLWLPIFWGALQGQQNFLWLGWSMMLNAAGRLGLAVVVVLVLGGYAAGMMSGVCLGLGAAVGIAVWQTRRIWTQPSLPFDWRTLLRQVIPLIFGFGAFQFLFTADTIFVKAYFDQDTAGFYGSAGTLSRALMWLVGPLAAVMFPRIVHSEAKSEKTDLMNLVLVGTGILAAVGAVMLSVLGPWIVRIVSGARFVEVASSLLPWYAGAMVPLALANVLLNNLMARSFFRVVPALCLLAVGYGFALTRFHSSPVSVLKTLAFFNVLLLGVCAWGNWSINQRGEASEGGF